MASEIITFSLFVNLVEDKRGERGNMQQKKTIPAQSETIRSIGKILFALRR